MSLLQPLFQMHHAKSQKPFGLFANENHEPGNEPNQKQQLREVQLKIHWITPLCTEVNDASA